MASYLKSTAYTRLFKLISSTDHLSLKTGVTATVNISKAGAAFGAAAGTVTEVANGWYKVALTTVDTNTAGDLAFYITGTGADDTDFCDQVLDPTVANVGVNVVNINSVAAATPGAAGGLLISGSNSGTTTFGALTVTGSMTISDGLLVSRSTSNASAITATGNGTGSGAVFTSGSGATGSGVQMTAASTNGDGLRTTGTGSANGFTSAGGATGDGANWTGGVTSGAGLRCSATSGDGFVTSGGTNGNGWSSTGVGTGHGFIATGGTTGGASSIRLSGGNAGLNIQPTNGDAIVAVGGAGNGKGLSLTGNGTAAGASISSGSGATGNGLDITAASTNGHGATVTATGTGTGLKIASVSGDALSAIASTSGNGITATATGTSKHGAVITGGTAGTSDGIKAVAGTGGVDFRANQTGNLVGTVSTLTTYTGNTPQTGDAYARLGAPAGASVSADVAAVKSDTALIKTATNTGVAPGAASGLAIVGSNMGTVTSVTGAVGSVTGAVGSIAASGITRASFATDTGLQSLRSNTAQAGGATSITLDASASAVTDFYKNALIIITSGTGVGQGRFCTAYNGTTKVATVTAWATNPDNTSIFAILAFDAIVGATAPTAAQNATAVWQDLLAGTDFGTAASIGALLKADIDATISSRSTFAGGAVASVTARVTANTDQLAGQTVTAAAGVTFPTSVASPTNITAGTITTATNLTTNNDKTGYALSSAGVQAIWDALTSALTTVGSIGKRIADFVTGDAYTRLGAPAGASVSADVAAIKSDTAAVKTSTNTGVAPGAASGLAIVGSAMTLTSGERTSVADAYLDRADAIETGLTPRQAHRLEAAAAAGKLSGAATASVVIRNAVADSKNRITATVDSDGNRSAVTTDVS